MRYALLLLAVGMCGCKHVIQPAVTPPDTVESCENQIRANHFDLSSYCQGVAIGDAGSYISEHTAPPESPDTELPGGILQSRVTGDSELSFYVTFSTRLARDRSLRVRVESEPWLEDTVEFQDQIQQKPRGAWIDFDCDNIAEKIIDKEVVAEVTPLCPILHKHGSAFWRTHNYVPDEFIDNTGTVWKKAGSNESLPH